MKANVHTSPSCRPEPGLPSTGRLAGTAGGSKTGPATESTSWRAGRVPAARTTGLLLACCLPLAAGSFAELEVAGVSAGAVLPVEAAEAASLGARVERRFAAMGTMCSLSLLHDSRSSGLRASERGARALEDVEQRLSSWRSDSELARLNATPVGEWFTPSADLLADLAFCAELVQRTEGAFDPGHGGVSLARRGADGPADAEAVLAPDGGFAGFVRQGDRIRRRHADALLDAGGFGKGIGLDRALAALLEQGARDVVLDLGGQVLVSPDGGSHAVELAHPRDRSTPVVRVSIGHGSLATSGTSERGQHLFDPQTSRCALDFGSATVWASSAALADALSTALFVMGPERALAFAEADERVEVLLLLPADDGLVARASSGLRGQLEALVADLRLVFP